MSLIAKDVDPEDARQALARLQDPVAKALTKRKNGGPATFETIQIAGLQAQSLTVSPAVDLTYATWDDLLVIATDSLGIQQAALARQRPRRVREVPGRDRGLPGLGLADRLPGPDRAAQPRRAGGARDRSDLHDLCARPADADRGGARGLRGRGPARHRSADRRRASAGPGDRRLAARRNSIPGRRALRAASNRAENQRREANADR